MPRVFHGFAPNQVASGLSATTYNTEHLGDTSTGVRGKIRKSSSTSGDNEAAKFQGDRCSKKRGTPRGRGVKDSAQQPLM